MRFKYILQKGNNFNCWMHLIAENRIVFAKPVFWHPDRSAGFNSPFIDYS